MSATYKLETKNRRPVPVGITPAEARRLAVIRAKSRAIRAEARAAKGA